MGRRRKSESLAETLIVLPWWIGVGIGVAGFAAVRWALPPVLPPAFKVSASILDVLSWLPLAAFGGPGLLSLARSWISQRKNPSADAPGLQLQPAAPHLFDEHPKLITAWTLEGLRELEWKRFELLCAKYYEAVGFKSETIRCGADGGIDVKLYRNDPTKPLAIVQCKAWNSAPVGVKDVRELLGVMAHEKVARGVFITTSTYTKDALSFGARNPIQLLDGEGFVRKILDLPKERQDELLKFAFEGDYRTPTCASCGIRMVKREGKRGAFWGCLNYPKCRNSFQFRTA